MKQYETKPYKIFRGGPIVLIVSGVGRNNSRIALESIFARTQFKTALNIGTAGCTDSDIPIGTLFCPFGSAGDIPKMPLKTFDVPVIEMTSNETCLVDMEGEQFLETAGVNVSADKTYILKVVSDHLDDKIRNSIDLDSMVADTINQWEFLLDDYAAKLEAVIDMTPFENLGPEDQKALRQAALVHRFSYQELKQLVEMALDFSMWGEASIHECLNRNFRSRKDAFESVRKLWDALKDNLKTYKGFHGGLEPGENEVKRTTTIARDMPGFGRCPVASPRTRCCNLLTLDAVEGCGFDCSYCSVRYFYDGETIGIDANFPQKLKSIEIDPLRNYHIGTGQSSDSLMWGNKGGILDAVLDFAEEHPNVILELKTKSDNVSHLLSRDVPHNVITTWSLNTSVIIENEEHYTASLEDRLNAAAKMAEKGNLIGFHMHPMVQYDEWRNDYGGLIHQLVRRFRPEDTALVSFGTLTFIKPVIRKMRARKMKSKVLQMPLEDAEGKLSYPLAVKKDMFKFAYDSFAEWHDDVFFYLCMEDTGLWPDVFSFEYSDNDAFEAAMIDSYKEKIGEKRNSHR